jgi:hypothetical protein
MPATLEYWLGRYYEARVLLKGNLAEVTATIRQRFQADQTLAAAGKAKLDTISDDVAKQCFVSKIQREALLTLLSN